MATQKFVPAFPETSEKETVQEFFERMERAAAEQALQEQSILPPALPVIPTVKKAAPRRKSVSADSEIILDETEMDTKKENPKSINLKKDKDFTTCMGELMDVDVIFCNNDSNHGLNIKLFPHAIKRKSLRIANMSETCDVFVRFEGDSSRKYRVLPRTNSYLNWGVSVRAYPMKKQ